jgi:hypothetical protein
MPKTYADLTVANATAGNAILASDFSTLFTNSNGFRKPPMCRARRSAALSFTSGSIFAVNFDVQDIDTDDMFTPTSNIFTIQTAGVYQLSASVSLNANATGQRYVALVLNPTFSGSGDTATITAGTRLAAQANSASVDTESVVTCSTLYNFAAADRIAVLYYQSSTSTLSMNTTVQTTLSAAWLGQAT